ncbi:MAG: cysteine--tRNA ligase [Candidatus Aenigmarchaeota archaeon]|nr:cysteine--tRNA ligase [Candidatus Aenigmarchaeota archaeon]
MLKFYNTLTKEKEEFKPLDPTQVKIYNCGPTVYDYAHIGNLRSYVFADLLRRYLKYKDFGIKQIMNITDVGHMVGDEDASKTGEDKMEKAAKKEGKTVWDIANFYTKAFLEDSKKMNIEEPEARPKATEEINEMMDLVQKLITNGFAYISNGSVYFDITKFKHYGELSGNTIENLKTGAGGRVNNNPDKKNQLDFALWVNNPEHVMKWKSPWSEGYPGWHLECSAMANKYLGETIDIHTGGEDNIFPHHESEIAQSEGANGKPFVKYWMHTRHLLVNNEKMSKSKGNFYTLRDIEGKGFSPKALRYLFLSAHYRTPLNFTEENLKAAENTINNMINFLDRLEDVEDVDKYNETIDEKINETEKKFEENLDDDLNMPEALAAIFDLVSFVNKAIDDKEYSTENLTKTHETLMKFDKVLGVLEHDKIEITEELKELLGQRESARNDKDFKLADEIRDQLKDKGFVIEDSLSGPRLKKSLKF